MLEHVTPAEIEGLLQSKQGDLGPQTINHLRRFLVRAFNKAIKRGSGSARIRPRRSIRGRCPRRS